VLTGVEVFGALGDFVFPSVCRICRARLSQTLSVAEGENQSENYGLICSACEKTSSRLAAPLCSACRQILPAGAGFCPSCAKPESVTLFAFGLFDPFNRELLHRLKYYGDRPAGDFLGNRLGKLVFSLEKEPKWDAIVPVPLHWTRKWSRGFNQSLILAKAVSKTLGVPVLSALRRTKRTQDQTKLSRSARLANVRGAFRVVSDVKGKKLLLLDDVSTTGATLEECRRVLADGGAEEISAAVVALANDG
jgi:ComF family protein